MKKNEQIDQDASMKFRLLIFFGLSLVVASVVFLSVRFGINYIVRSLYCTEWNQNYREDRYAERLQTYIDKNGISKSNFSELTAYAASNRYFYLQIYDGDALIYSPTHTTAIGQILSSNGLTLDLPAEELLERSAHSRRAYILTVPDGQYTAYVCDFTEYIYFDLANVCGFLLGFFSCCYVMMLYYHRVAHRISRLGRDVSTVCDGDMNHPIVIDEEGDEITQLAANVEDMRRTLLDDLEKEREASDMNTELITSLSHDIRTPLTVLLGYLDVMKLRSTDDVTKSYIKASESTAMHMKDLTDDMFRYFLAFGNRDPELAVAKYDAATLLDQMLAEHILLMREAGFDVEQKVGEELTSRPINVAVDAPFLMRIIDNLFSNLKKYADPKHAVKVDIHRMPGIVQVRFVNRIRHFATPTESSRIGLKTCRRIASAMNVGFHVVNDGTVYTTILDLPMDKDSAEEDKNIAILSAIDS